MISWGRVGDSIGTLVPKGYSVIRGNTGYANWKREGLASMALGVKGEALAIFNPHTVVELRGGHSERLASTTTGRT